MRAIYFPLTETGEHIRKFQNIALRQTVQPESMGALAFSCLCLSNFNRNIIFTERIKDYQAWLLQCVRPCFSVFANDPKTLSFRPTGEICFSSGKGNSRFLPSVEMTGAEARLSRHICATIPVNAGYRQIAVADNRNGSMSIATTG